MRPVITLRAVQWLCVLLVLALIPMWAAAQDFEFHPPPNAGDPIAATVMRDLAERILPVFEEKDTERYLRNLAALQMVAGTYVAAHDTRQSLRDRRRNANTGESMDRALLYDIYAHARAIEAGDRVPFAQAFTRSFREVVPKLNDRDAHALTVWFETPPAVFRDALQRSFDRWRAKGSIPQAEAVDLVWTYLSFDAHRSFRPLVDALDVEEERRRYVTEENVVIKTAFGAEIHALVVRPKSVTTPLPALLEFTIHLAGGDAKGCAAHGYVGVVAYTRGKKGPSRSRVVPFQYDGEDARAVIAWIAKQPWSDGRVGMVGDGYSGFAAWAALRRAPSALKAIATSAPMAPGIDFPMQGQVFPNSAYRWVQTHTDPLAPTGEHDAAYWRELNQAWYKSGKRYRDLDRKFGEPNRIFRRWLNHPSYDRYWQKMIPFRQQFARIDIPVLTIAGYYGGDAGALHYFRQHHQYKSDAQHTLLIGPWDDGAIRHGPAPVLQAYPIDTAALIDLRELRYQWFDHIFKGSAKPGLLKDRVNYEVMGANEWRHTSSLEGMANSSLRFHLDVEGAGDRRRLMESKPPAKTFLEQIVDFADRSDFNWLPSFDILGKSPSVHHGLTFVSEPLQQIVEFSGLLSGQLDFAPNKQDMDLKLSFYELLPSGAYLQLFDPYEFRASYLKDRVHRRLLQAGVRQQLKFTIERLSSRRLQIGSRLVVVLAVNKRPDREINYGAGNDVSEESTADARIPLKIRWYGDSYVDIPIRKPGY